MKISLGDDYQKYFTTIPSNNVASSLELIHYSETLWDRQIIDIATYRTNKESHVYCLLRRLVAVAKDAGVGIHL